MAVYRRAYRPYDGPLTPERTRFLAVARYALAELSESKVLMGFVVLCMFPFLIEAIGIYVASSGPARAILRISGQPDPMNAEFFGVALVIQGALAVMLSAWVAPVLVSPDLVNGALPLYLSRPIFVHRPSFDGWPKAIQEELRAAVRDAVAFQRDLHVKEEAEAAAAIKKSGGEIVELTADQHKAFVSAVTPIYKEARSQFDRSLLALVDL